MKDIAIIIQKSRRAILYFLPTMILTQGPALSPYRGGQEVEDAGQTNYYGTGGSEFELNTAEPVTIFLPTVQCSLIITEGI